MLEACAVVLAIVFAQYKPQIWAPARDEAARKQLLTQPGG